MKEDTLSGLREQLSQKRNLEEKINGLYEHRSQQERAVISLRAQYRQEQENVQKLEKRSLGNCLLRLRGKLAERQEQKQLDMQAAAKKLAAAETQLEEIRGEIREVQYQLAQLRIAEAKYQELLEEKRRLLRNADTEEGKTIRQLEQEVKLLEKQKSELQQAISVGNRARGTAMRILSKLDSADSWNTLDMLGGGTLSYLEKHAHLDDAQSMLEDLSVDLKKFQSELKDVKITLQMQVNVDGFLRFSDWFFDGIFSELAVKEQISQSQASIQHTKDRISQTLGKLEAMKDGVEREIQERKGLLEELLTVE